MKKGLKVLLICLGVGGGGTAAYLGFKKAAGTPTQPQQPSGGAKYTCMFGDGFQANTWANMLAHYQTAHPGSQISSTELQWQ